MNKKIIYKEKITNNLAYLTSFGKKLTIMVKANAYGHGISVICKLLKDYDVKLGVATIYEAVNLRKYWKKEIIIVEPIYAFHDVKKHDLQFVIDDLESLIKVKKEKLLENCYLKINTGMNRFGIRHDDIKVLKKVAKIIKRRKIKGVLTHFSDFGNQKFTSLQYQRLKKALDILPEIENISLGGSGVLKTNFDFNEARIGIAFYGFEDDKVEPILQIRSQIIKIIELNIGDELGYGCEYKALENKRIAIVGIGYGDGIRRDLSGFVVKIHNEECHIIGRICMDCLFVDISNIKCKLGDEVVFYDAKSISEYLNTIPYEVLTGFSNLRGETIVE